MSDLVKIIWAATVMVVAACLTMLLQAEALWSQTAAAWVQAVGSILAIGGAVWAAGLPLRQQVRERTAARAQLIIDVEEAGRRIFAHRLVWANCVMLGDGQGFSDADDSINADNFFLARATLSVDTPLWPSVRLRAAMARAVEAGTALDEAVEQCQGSFRVALINRQMTMHRSGAVIAAATEFDLALRWAKQG